jgi:hypothetical protein
MSLAELILFAGILCTVLAAIFPHFHGVEVVDRIGLCMLLLGALLEIRQAKKDARKTKQYMEELQSSLKTAQQFGPAVLSFSDTIRGGPREAASIHVKAAGSVLYDFATQKLPHLADGLKELQQKNRTLELPGDFAAGLLNRLVHSLPVGSTLWGATHMTSEWLSKTTDDVVLQEIANTLCTLSEEKKLSAFRIYDVGSAENIPGLREHINRELKAGMSVRITQKGYFVPDINLFWNSRDVVHPSQRKGFGSPSTTVPAAENAGLCGLLFETQFLRYLQSVNICGPNSNDFSQLTRLFQEAWESATPARITKDNAVRRTHRPDRRNQAA